MSYSVSTPKLLYQTDVLTSTVNPVHLNSDSKESSPLSLISSTALGWGGPRARAAGAADPTRAAGREGAGAKGDSQGSSLGPASALLCGFGEAVYIGLGLQGARHPGCRHHRTLPHGIQPVLAHPVPCTVAQFGGFSCTKWGGVMGQEVRELLVCGFFKNVNTMWNSVQQIHAATTQVPGWGTQMCGQGPQTNTYA